MAYVPFVGLTGGLGSGKSTALEALARLGAATASSDEIVHAIYDDPDVVRSVAERFGDAVAPDGVVDRSALADAAFASSEGREWLEALIWPLVGERIARWLQDARSRRPAPPAAVVEVPLLFEAGKDDSYDATIAVVADEALRDERARSRGHAAVDGRAARQLTQAEKAARATYVVHNDGTINELEAQLSSILDNLKG